VRLNIDLLRGRQVITSVLRCGPDGPKYSPTLLGLRTQTVEAKRLDSACQRLHSTAD